MRLVYTVNERITKEFTKIQYEEKEKKFLLIGMDGMNMEYYPVLDIEKEYNPEDFSVVLLNNKVVTENSIFTVEVKSLDEWTRIGWIFPIQALLSREHSQVENKHFLKYAYVATYLLLDKINNHVKDTEPYDFFLDDFYNPEQIVLITDNSCCKSIDGYSLEKYIVGLYKYGYTWTGSIELSGSLPESTDARAGRLKINSISEEINSWHFINMLYKDYLPIKMRAFVHMCGLI